jgi:hypothetical protein
MARSSVPMIGGPTNWAKRQPALICRPKAEPAPHVRKRRFSGIAAQQGRHRHDRVVVAVQARNVQFAGIGHQVGQGRRDGHRPLLNRRRHHGRRAWSSRSQPWSASTRLLFRRSHCPASGGGGAAPHLPGLARDDVRLINRLGRNGLSRFAKLVVCDVPDEVADEHIVLGLNRCLLIANQLASNERADGV